jgi:hypothetical protein
MNENVKIVINHKGMPLLGSLLFLVLGICFFPLLLLFIPFFFCPGPEPVIPLFAASNSLTSFPRAAKQRERSPPR